MSTEHRKPVMAFVVLALLAAGLVGVQRADAHAGRLFAAVAGVSVRVQGTVPVTPGLLAAAAREQAATMGPFFEAVAFIAHETRAEVFAADAPLDADAEAATPRSSDETRTAREAAPAAGSTARHGESAATPAPLTAERGSDLADRTGPAAHVVEGATERLGSKAAERLERKAERRTARAERRAARAERRVERAERRADRVVRRAERRAARWGGLIQRRSERAAGAARAPRGSDLRDRRGRGRGRGHQVDRSGRPGSPWPGRR